MLTNTAGKRLPEDVKAALIQAAIDGASLYGFAEVSVQEMAALAGVSKGGLFHYFATRQELVDAAFDKCLGDYGNAINAYVQDDEVTHGRFTRAYIAATIDACLLGDDDTSAFVFSALTSKRYITRWRTWMLVQFKKHPTERNSKILRVARSAADGLWLQNYGTQLSEQEQATVEEIRSSLIALTMPK